MVSFSNLSIAGKKHTWRWKASGKCKRYVPLLSFTLHNTYINIWLCLLNLQYLNVFLLFLQHASGKANKLPVIVSFEGALR